MPVSCAVIAAAIEKMAPLTMAESWDNVGLLVGCADRLVERALLTVDVTPPVIEEAIKLGATMLIAHHPFPFQALKRLQTDTETGAMLSRLLKHDIAVYAAHTNLDMADGGINTALAKTLRLTDVQPLRPYRESLVKIVVYVPAGHEDAVRSAMSEAGAGHIGNYSDCSFRTTGLGTYKPLAGSRPFLGELAKLSTVEEIRLETVAPEKLLKEVIQAMLDAHPYEEVAYDVLPLRNTHIEGGLGRIGCLEKKVRLSDFAEEVKQTLAVSGLRVYGSAETRIRRVAVCGGAGMDCASVAVAAGAAVLVTGDIRYHDAQAALSQGLCLIDAGHFATEYPGMVELGSRLRRIAAKAEWDVDFHVAQCQTDIYW